ncbi:MAG: hypothetical protein EOP08_12470 [Proteobacteria bacterium]|nr:MAG: hypothetical protein EOP08_12470 [Pseudomonadota bacterium]
MSHDISCWKCGASLSALSLPFDRRDTCRACGADLHVSRRSNGRLSADSDAPHFQHEMSWLMRPWTRGRE